MYEFYHYCLKPYWQDKTKSHYMDIDCFVQSFKTDHKKVVDLLKQNKDDFDFSELDAKHVLYGPSKKNYWQNEKGI